MKVLNGFLAIGMIVSSTAGALENPYYSSNVICSAGEIGFVVSSLYTAKKANDIRKLKNQSEPTRAIMAETDRLNKKISGLKTSIQSEQNHLNEVRMPSDNPLVQKQLEHIRQLEAELATAQSELAVSRFQLTAITEENSPSSTAALDAKVEELKAKIAQEQKLLDDSRARGANGELVKRQLDTIKDMEERLNSYLREIIQKNGLNVNNLETMGNEYLAEDMKLREMVKNKASLEEINAESRIVAKKFLDYKNSLKVAAQAGVIDAETAVPFLEQIEKLQSGRRADLAKIGTLIKSARFLRNAGFAAIIGSTVIVVSSSYLGNVADQYKANELAAKNAVSQYIVTKLDQGATYKYNYACKDFAPQVPGMVNDGINAGKDVINSGRSYFQKLSN